MPIDKPFTPEPLAFFLTWTTHGSWLPGDDRGWADDHGRLQAPSARLAKSAASRLTGPAVVLTPAERLLVLETIATHCRHRGWKLWAAACRSQHVHVVVSAPEYDAATVSQQLKAWTSRCLAVGASQQQRTWTRGCSRRRIYDEAGLQAVVHYVSECQDRGDR